MGFDVPDGVKGIGDSGYNKILHQYAVPFVLGQYATLAHDETYILGYVNDSDTHLVRVRGWRALCLDRTQFSLYLYYNLQGLGYYNIDGQYECLYPAIDSFLLGKDDYFAATLLNTDASSRVLRFYVLGERFLKPSGWIRRPNCSWSVDDNTPAVDQVITFTDESLYNPTEWLWNFGDGGVSTEQNPTHAYTKAGTYTVILLVRSVGGDDVFSATVTVT